MDEKSDAFPATVVVRKSLPFPAELAFNAWCDPAQIMQWFCPSEDVFLLTVEMDVRPGGQFRFVYARRSDGGVELEVNGEYKVVDAPTRLVFSWIWSAHMPEAGAVTEVSIELVEKNGMTELTLTHSSVPGTPMKEALSQGWAMSLDGLARFDAE